MATIYIDVTLVGLTEGPTYILNVKDEAGNDITLSSNRLSLTQGDYVRFRWVSKSGNAPTPSSILFSSLRTQVWEATSATVSSIGSYTQVRVKTTAELGTETIQFQVPDWSGSGIKTVYLNILDDIDTTPDSFTLGPDQTNLQPNTLFYFDTIYVSGINSATAVSVSGTGMEFKINTGSWRTTSTTLLNGDRVYCRVTTQSDYGSGNKTVSLTIGGVTDSCLIGTLSSEELEVILFPLDQGDPIPHSEIGDFFGRRDIYTSNTYHTDYVKGGGYVPTISPYNDDIPSSLPLPTMCFGGSATTFYFEVYPSTKFDSKDTSGGSQQVRVTWAIGTDFKPGYGLGIQSTVDIRYKVEITGTRPPSFSIYPYEAEDTFSSWFNITTFPELQLSMTAAQNTEAHVHGTITIEMRHPQDPTGVKTVSASANFLLDAYGP